jgi:DNA-binding response OmpR family regulator
MTAASYDPGSRPPTRCVRLLKVLVLDRDTTAGPAIRLALEEAGYYLNCVSDVHEGCRRVQERAYDLVILSDSVGLPAVQGILDTLARRVSPPGVIVLAGPDGLRMDNDSQSVPCLSILRRPCSIQDVVDTARAMVGVPWSDHREGT